MRSPLPRRRLVAVGLVVAACTPEATTTRTESFDPAQVERVDLRSADGTITLSPGEDGRGDGTIDAQLRWRGDEAPELYTRLAGTTLLVESRCPPSTRRCAIDLTLDVPPTLDVDVRCEAGDVVVEGLVGLIDVETGEGTATLTGTTGNARVDVGQGDIVLDAVAGGVDAFVERGGITGTGLAAYTLEARAGNQPVELAFDTAPDLVDVSTQAGDVTLTLPSGEYDVDASSRRGEVVVEGVTSTSNAPAVVLLQSVGGDLRIEGR